MEKQCSGCLQVKELDRFSKNKNGKFGVYSKCKNCRHLKFSKDGHVQKAYKKNKYNTDKTSFLKASKKWYEANKEQAQHNKRIYYKNNKHVAYASSAKRRASQDNRVLGYFEEIKEIYKKAIKQNKEVHHIIPLNEFSDKVSGLHVPWNLELLTKEEHLIAHENLRREWN
jgi:uncharacterized Zn finger protein (UPF0148 family)